MLLLTAIIFSSHIMATLWHLQPKAGIYWKCSASHLLLVHQMVPHHIPSPLYPHWSISQYCLTQKTKRTGPFHVRHLKLFLICSGPIVMRNLALWSVRTDLNCFTTSGLNKGWHMQYNLWLKVKQAMLFFLSNFNFFSSSYQSVSTCIGRVWIQYLILEVKLKTCLW